MIPAISVSMATELPALIIKSKPSRMAAKIAALPLRVSDMSGDDRDGQALREIVTREAKSFP
jgi:hypothetical protein